MYSTYIIDGAQMPQTPAQMLNSCMPDACRGGEDGTGFENIVDETVDPALRKTAYSPDGILSYLEKVRKIKSGARPEANISPKSYTRRKIAAALLDTLWKKGHFTLEDLGVRAAWKWDCAPMGNMAAFYFSAEAAGEYLFDLNIRLDGYSFEKLQDVCDVLFSVSAEVPAAEDTGDEYDFINEKEPKEMRYCWISDEDKCGRRLIDSPSSWVIYIPFDTCAYRLGGSLFEKAAGISGDSAPEIQDPDYFIDCFEVVRELIEDGMIMSGATAGEGGLAAAAASLCGNEGGLCIDISGIERASGETDPLRILFSEIPGVLIQIQDSDYDYVDSQFLLQDIAYFPLGHPSETAGIGFTHGRKGVSDILASLLQGNIPEDDQDA